MLCAESLEAITLMMLTKVEVCPDATATDTAECRFDPAAITESITAAGVITPLL